MATITLFSVTVQDISIISYLSLLQHLPGKPLTALAINSSWCLAIPIAEKAMNHVFCDNLVQNWIFFLVWNFNTYNAVYLVWANFGLQPNQKMHVWQSSLLPFNGVHEAGYFSKHLDILDDIHHFLNFLLKHPGNQVITICCN
ncbi:hypothetical protein TNCT_634071 [Trichonephila clavata]|uniref:Uncharacterized protein n=1 Tax=Trichonephila clavata TaxID=2740835 RepID=A0A8X6FNE2_TRICU|nr:hypothetical protein TNCT_634071 [Trichonephila clavata]